MRIAWFCLARDRSKAPAIVGLYGPNIIAQLPLPTIILDRRIGCHVLHHEVLCQMPYNHGQIDVRCALNCRGKSTATLFRRTALLNAKCFHLSEVTTTILFLVRRVRVTLLHKVILLICSAPLLIEKFTRRRENSPSHHLALRPLT